MVRDFISGTRTHFYHEDGLAKKDAATPFQYGGDPTPSERLSQHGTRPYTISEPPFFLSPIEVYISGVLKET